jgi:hypothetical protein
MQYGARQDAYNAALEELDMDPALNATATEAEIALYKQRVRDRRRLFDLARTGVAAALVYALVWLDPSREDALLASLFWLGLLTFCSWALHQLIVRPVERDRW